MPGTKIPKHAQRVFHGTVFDIYQWRQKMYDGSTKLFEVAKRLDGACVLAAVGDKMVVLRQSQPTKGTYYSLPGGFMDKPGESPRKAALRELLEETGMRPQKLKYWRNFSRGGARMITSLHVFIAQDCKKVADQALDGGEKIEIKLVSFDKFLDFFDKPDFHATELMLEIRSIKTNIRKKAVFCKLIFGS
jgi:ADP-ribose pyrophosphatase